MPNNGLASLGQAISDSSRDYMTINLQRQAEERARSNRLAELQDQRLYSEGRDNVNLARQKDLTIWQARQARIQELIAKGLLAQADAADDLKVAAADAADQKRTIELRTRGDTSRSNMEAAANAIGEQVNQLYDQADKVQMELMKIPRAPATPSPKQIEATAIQLAQAAGEDPKSDAVRVKYVEPAKKALEGAAMQQFYLAQEAADALKVSLQGYNAQIAGLNRRLEQFEHQGIVPTIKPPAATGPTGALSAPAPALRAATPSESAAAAGAPQPSAAPSVAPSAPAASLSDPSLAPATSVLGLSQRAPQWAPAVGKVIADTAALPGRAIDAVGRYGGAALNGLWNGNFSVPETGLVEAAGRGVGSLLAPDPYKASAPAAFEAPTATQSPRATILDTLYPQVPNYGGGMRNMTDTERQAYDINKQAKKTGGYLFRGF